jgi:hypothetical protein
LDSRLVTNSSSNCRGVCRSTGHSLLAALSRCRTNSSTPHFALERHESTSSRRTCHSRMLPSPRGAARIQPYRANLVLKVAAPTRRARFDLVPSATSSVSRFEHWATRLRRLRRQLASLVISSRRTLIRPCWACLRQTGEYLINWLAPTRTGESSSRSHQANEERKSSSSGVESSERFDTQLMKFICHYPRSAPRRPTRFVNSRVSRTLSTHSYARGWARGTSTENALRSVMKPQQFGSPMLKIK